MVDDLEFDIMDTDHESHLNDFNETNEFDDPNGSEWIIGVDAWGKVFIVEAPNIHPGFLQFKNSEEIGLPYELPEEKPGIYSATMAFVARPYGQYGADVEYEFEPTRFDRIDYKGLNDD